jgi:hypothetical protein
MAVHGRLLRLPEGRQVAFGSAVLGLPFSVQRLCPVGLLDVAACCLLYWCQQIGTYIT